MIATLADLVGLDNARTVDGMIRPNVENEVVLARMDARKAARVRKVYGCLLRLFIDGAKRTKVRQQQIIDRANVRRFVGKLIVHGVSSIRHTLLLATKGAHDDANTEATDQPESKNRRIGFGNDGIGQTKQQAKDQPLQPSGNGQ